MNHKNYCFPEISFSSIALRLLLRLPHKRGIALLFCKNDAGNRFYLTCPGPNYITS